MEFLLPPPLDSVSLSIRFVFFVSLVSSVCLFLLAKDGRRRRGRSLERGADDPWPDGEGHGPGNGAAFALDAAWEPRH